MPQEDSSSFASDFDDAAQPSPMAEKVEWLNVLDTSCSRKECNCPHHIQDVTLPFQLLSSSSLVGRAYLLHSSFLGSLHLENMIAAAILGGVATMFVVGQAISSRTYQNHSKTMEEMLLVIVVPDEKVQVVTAHSVHVRTTKGVTSVTTSSMLGGGNTTVTGTSSSKEKEGSAVVLGLVEEVTPTDLLRIMYELLDNSKVCSHVPHRPRYMVEAGCELWKHFGFFKKTWKSGQPVLLGISRNDRSGPTMILSSNEKTQSDVLNVLDDGGKDVYQPLHTLFTSKGRLFRTYDPIVGLEAEMFASLCQSQCLNMKTGEVEDSPLDPASLKAYEEHWPEGDPIPQSCYVTVWESYTKLLKTLGQNGPKEMCVKPTRFDDVRNTARKLDYIYYAIKRSALLGGRLHPNILAGKLEKMLDLGMTCTPSYKPFRRLEEIVAEKATRLVCHMFHNLRSERSTVKLFLRSGRE